MALPQATVRHRRRVGRIGAALVLAMRQLWRKIEPKGSWEQQYADQVGPGLTALVLAGQTAIANEADAYMADVLNELAFGPTTEPGVLNPRGFVGVTGDGRPVDTLLGTSVGRARNSLARERQRTVESGSGLLTVTRSPSEADLRSALDDGEAFMASVTASLIADANREAELVAMAQRPWVDGWVRVINPPCCSRCAVLSGKFFLFNEGFLRHPLCDCSHLPAPSDKKKVADLIAVNSPDRYFESLTEAEQNRIFTTAGAQAIRDGADIDRVVNARRGMSKAQDTGRLKRVRVNGRDLYVTTEATTKRGRYPTQNKGVRLMPESIAEIAGGDRDEFIRLLRLNGYLL